jgi:hypothetical protein
MYSFVTICAIVLFFFIIILIIGQCIMNYCAKQKMLDALTSDQNRTTSDIKLQTRSHNHIGNDDEDSGEEGYISSDDDDE